MTVWCRELLPTSELSALGRKASATRDLASIGSSLASCFKVVISQGVMYAPAFLLSSSFVSACLLPNNKSTNREPAASPSMARNSMMRTSLGYTIVHIYCQWQTLVRTQTVPNSSSLLFQLPISMESIASSAKWSRDRNLSRRSKNVEHPPERQTQRS